MGLFNEEDLSIKDILRAEREKAERHNTGPKSA
jgi:hypothetical protein